MICTTCFAENAEGADACAVCGRALPQIVPETDGGPDQAAEAAAALPSPARERQPEPPVFRDPTTLKTWVIGLLVCYGVVMAVSGVFDVMQIALIDDMEAGNFASQEEMMEAAGAHDARQQMIGVLYLASFIATVVVFGMWIFRMAKNARAFTSEPFDTTPNWAVGAYFIPIVNLWIPYRAMSEIWRASRNPTGWKADRAGAFLGWWWAIWVGSNLVANFTAFDAETLPELRRASQIALLTSACGLATVVMGVLLVKQLTAYQMKASSGETLSRVFE